MKDDLRSQKEKDDIPDLRDVKKISRWDIFSPDEQPSVSVASRMFASNRR